MSVSTLESMIHWVKVNIKENPTLEEMSSYVGYSPYYCSNKFHEYTGVTFKQYIAKMKVMAAGHEIENSTRRIGDIAFDYGFSSQEAFTRAFTLEYGLPPSKFRKKLRA